tara:strand:+ start:224 stop:1051 length:828 start_codon:yes stop_codon:yes gene_type:complete
MKIAIGFFGLTRSLKYTINSIKSNLLDVLNDNNIEYDICLHTYNVNFKTYTNIRTGEGYGSMEMKEDTIDNEEYKLLSPKYFHIDDLDVIKEKLDLPKYRSQKDNYNNKYSTADNIILAFYSKYMLTNLIEKHENEYDYVIYMRPDCEYLHKFNINNYLRDVNDNSIVIPDFSIHGIYNLPVKYRINDRLCIANMKSYKIYGNAFTKLLELSKKYSLHSETMLGMILKDEKIKNVKKPIHFLRVRYHGRAATLDIPLLKKYPEYVESEIIQYKKK